MKIKNQKQFKNLSAQIPYILLSITASAFFLMIFGLNNAGIIDMRNALLSAGRHTLLEPGETLFTHRTYAEAKPQYSKFIENHVQEGEGVLFINDQISLGQNFVYYNIYTYSDKKIRYYFDGKNITDERVIAAKMKENNIQYVFSFENPNPVYGAAKTLKDKTFLLRLSGDKLELVAVYD